MDALSFLHACFFPPSSPAQSLDYLICPAVPPATTTRRASSTEAKVSPALRPETLNQRRTVSPCPAAAAAALLRRRCHRGRLLLLGLKVEGGTVEKRWRARCWRAVPRGWCRPVLRIHPPPLLHHRGPCPTQKLWFPPSTCRWFLRNTPATHFTSSDSRRRRRRKMEEKRAEPGLCLHRRGGSIHHHSSTSHPATTSTNICTRSPCSPSTYPSFQVRVKGRPRPSTHLLCSPGQCSTAGLRLRLQLSHIWRFHIRAGAVPAGPAPPLGSRTNTAADGTVERRCSGQHSSPTSRN